MHCSLRRVPLARFPKQRASLNERLPVHFAGTDDQYRQIAFMSLIRVVIMTS